jgi:hypothetical protein
VQSVLSAGPNAFERYGRYQESLRAVATCYRWTSGEFVCSEEAADGDEMSLSRYGCGPRDEAVGGLSGGLYYAPGRIRTGSTRAFAQA